MKIKSLTIKNKVLYYIPGNGIFEKTKDPTGNEYYCFVCDKKDFILRYLLNDIKLQEKAVENLFTD